MKTIKPKPFITLTLTRKERKDLAALVAWASKMAGPKEKKEYYKSIYTRIALAKFI